MVTSKTMYKLVYRGPQDSSAENAVMFKWFNTYEEASTYGSKLGDRILEIKQYDMPEHYPDAELDLF